MPNRLPHFLSPLLRAVDLRKCIADQGKAVISLHDYLIHVT